MKKVLERLKRLSTIKKVLMALVIVLALLIMARGCGSGGGGTSHSSSTVPGGSSSVSEVPLVTNEDDNNDQSINGGTDKLLAQMQPELTQEYGKPPEGFIWDQTGELVSLGIKGMSSEDVVYSYLRALSTTDFTVAQKLQRGASVVSQYKDFFDTRNAAVTRSDSSTEYQRNVFQQALLSLEVQGVTGSSVFAQDQRSYNVQLKVLDISNKDFWSKDKKTIFTNLYKLEHDQGDQTSAEAYLTNYIISAYKAHKVPKRSASVAITVQRYPDLNSGWLVSIDSDLNALLVNQNNTSPSDYIMEQYQLWKTQKLNS